MRYLETQIFHGQTNFHSKSLRNQQFYNQGYSNVQLIFWNANPGKLIQIFFQNFRFPSGEPGKFLENLSIFSNFQFSGHEPDRFLEKLIHIIWTILSDLDQFSRNRSGSCTKKGGRSDYFEVTFFKVTIFPSEIFC